MITLDQGANGDTKKMDKKDIVSPKAQDINLEDTGKDSPLDSNATSDVNMDDSEATDSSASSKSTPDPLFTSKMTSANVVKKCLNLYQLLQVNSRKNVFKDLKSSITDNHSSSTGQRGSSKRTLLRMQVALAVLANKDNIAALITKLNHLMETICDIEDNDKNRKTQRLLEARKALKSTK